MVKNKEPYGKQAIFDILNIQYLMLANKLSIYPCCYHDNFSSPSVKSVSQGSAKISITTKKQIDSLFQMFTTSLISSQDTSPSHCYKYISKLQIFIELYLDGGFEPACKFQTALSLEKKLIYKVLLLCISHSSIS